MHNYYISMILYYQDSSRSKALQHFTLGLQVKVEGKTNYNVVQQNKVLFMGNAQGGASNAIWGRFVGAPPKLHRQAATSPSIAL
jgi:hypothetical protein